MSKFFIKCGKFFDGVNQEWLHDIKILVEADRITAVGAELEQPADAELVDLSALTVTPGLIDTHAHFDFVGPNAFDTFAHMLSDERRSMNILHCARKSLMNGFTSIRIPGTSINSYGPIDARDAIAAGDFVGSRLFVAVHNMGVSGGHADYSSAFYTYPDLSDAMEALNPFLGHGPDFYRKAVRKEVKYGADFIKIYAGGGFASPNDDPADCELDDEELRTIIDTANKLNRRTTAHCYTSELAQKLLNMGISGIEHGSLIDEETCDLFIEKGAYLVCTFLPYDEAVNMDEEKLATKSKHFIRKLLKYVDQLRATRKLIIQKILEDKMIIGYGTDIVSVYDNTENWREYAIWRKSGIPALRTLKAATSANAAIIGNDEIGVLAPGKIADIVAWAKDVENDVEAISECSFVMKDGVIYKHA
ncbi:MAG: amidohydrolase family protein [Saccharofermentanales bacterium]|nr:amidohydrolase family protein [Clostridiaceae bacterium]